ncbi:MAG: MEKHLA domain-containing protein [Microcoleaceae cyanobacterium]
MIKEPWKQPKIITWSQIILDNYRNSLGDELIERKGNTEEQAKALFFTPFAVASHGTEADPIYNYGNQVILDLWERSWDEMIKTPSRLSAEPNLREERQNSLDQTTSQGYLKNYQCVRISRTGQRYKIEDITIWNLEDEQGNYCGQAATFSNWSVLN